MPLRMSALGQKQTYAAHKLMSALPPIATLIARGRQCKTIKTVAPDFWKTPQDK